MSKKDEDKKSALSRASERVKTVALSAFDPAKAKSALAFKLIAGGLALTALAAGIDYFSHDDEIHKIVAKCARDVQWQDVAETVEWWDVKCDGIKAATLEKLPLSVRDHLAGAALAVGVHREGQLLEG